MKTTVKTMAPAVETRLAVYCPMCTHTVEATVIGRGKQMAVKAGQKCPRCSGALDAGYIMRYDRAA